MPDHPAQGSVLEPFLAWLHSFVTVGDQNNHTFKAKRKVAGYLLSGKLGSSGLVLGSGILFGVVKLGKPRGETPFWDCYVNTRR